MIFVNIAPSAQRTTCSVSKELLPTSIRATYDDVVFSFWNVLRKCQEQLRHVAAEALPSFDTLLNMHALLSLGAVGIMVKHLVLTSSTNLKGLRLREDKKLPGKHWRFEYLAPRSKLLRKKISKIKRPETAKSVEIHFPIMNAPFGAPSAYSAKKKIHNLVVDFKNESNCEETRHLRQLLLKLQDRISTLIKRIDPSLTQPLSEQKKNLLVRPGKPVAQGKTECYPDQVNLKVIPGDITYMSPLGDTYDLTTVDFSTFDPEVKGHVRDIWKYNGVYYPRLMVTACALHPKFRIPDLVSDTEAEDSDDSGMADDESSDTEIEATQRAEHID